MALAGWFGWRRVRQARQRREQLIAHREDIDTEVLARQIAGEGIDPQCAHRELVALARGLGVPAGKLRPNDVVAELLGDSEIAGDDLLEIEVRLQRHRPEIAEQQLTVGELVRQLATIADPS